MALFYSDLSLQASTGSRIAGGQRESYHIQLPSAFAYAMPVMIFVKIRISCDCESAESLAREIESSRHIAPLAPLNEVGGRCNENPPEVCNPPLGYGIEHLVFKENQGFL